MDKQEMAKKMEWLLRDENIVQFIETFYKIPDKDTNIVQFKLTPEQKYFVHNLQNQNIVLKSRQLGLSVVTIALALRECIKNPGSSCLLVSHNRESCGKIFEKLKLQYDLLPSFLKPTQITNNRQELSFSNKSRISCVCAGNKDVARGDTINFCHLSEFAFWKNQAGQLNSITKALAPSSTLIIESTANGLNHFSDLYFKAANGENAFNDYFFNWIDGRTLFQEHYNNAVKVYENTYNKQLEENELNEEELKLKDLGATMDQLMWRRLEIANSNNNIDLFRQEYPSTPCEAFITSGSSIFNAERINNIEQSIITSGSTHLPLNQLDKLPISLKRFYNKSLFIYKTPKVGVKYYAGVDCSEGVGRDYSVITILDQDGEEVGVFYNNTIRPYEFAEVVNLLGRYFNNALLTVEKQSAGHSVIERLRYSFKYYNMTKYKSYDQFNKIITTIGFDTNQKNKSMAINDFVELFENGHIKINTRKTLQEMKIFEDNNGRMAAAGNGHDDMVMSFALAIQALKQGFHFRMKK